MIKSLVTFFKPSDIYNFSLQFSNILYYQDTLSKLNPTGEFEKKIEFFLIKEFVLILDMIGKAGKE